MSVRLTNRQLAQAGKSGSDLNDKFALEIYGAGYPVLTYKDWNSGKYGSPPVARSGMPILVREFPYKPDRLTWDYDKAQESVFHKERWCFIGIAKPRRWRWDFFCPALNIAIDLDGDTFAQGGKGGHSRGAQNLRDYLKRNEAEIDGLMVLRFDSVTVREGIALNFLERAIKAQQARR